MTVFSKSLFPMSISSHLFRNHFRLIDNVRFLRSFSILTRCSQCVTITRANPYLFQVSFLSTKKPPATNSRKRPVVEESDDSEEEDSDDDEEEDSDDEDDDDDDEVTAETAREVRSMKQGTKRVDSELLSVKKKDKTHKINEDVPVSFHEVRVSYTEANGQKKTEIMSRSAALKLAKSLEKDLILLVEDQTPPVCRIESRKAFFSEINKRKKDLKKQQKLQVPKEISLKTGIDIHDFSVKMRQSLTFVQQGQFVKVNIKMKRERINYQLTKSQRELITAHIPNTHLRDIDDITQQVKALFQRFKVSVTINDNYVDKFVPGPDPNDPNSDPTGHYIKVLDSRDVLASVKGNIAELKKIPVPKIEEIQSQLVVRPKEEELNAKAAAEAAEKAKILKQKAAAKKKARGDDSDLELL